ncbi:hypothetical protein ABIB25_004826 [Nakamurella sp. UYEF19]|uniref:hypothetical protein n=1 Tax=Nakamurella sp. UYEF19 TaxID=1756392 RepID=UPI003395D6AF
MALNENQDAGTEIMPCGRDPLEVVDRARLGRMNAHMRTCPYCQAMITADLPAGSAATSLRDESVQAPDTLLPAVMSTVWSELRPGRNIPLPAVNGSAFATEQAVTSMLEHDLDRLPDFVVHLCSVEAPDDEPEPVEPRTAPALRIEVRAAAAYAVDLAALANRARGVAAETLLHQFGLVAETIDINFVDVYEQQGATT